MVSGRGPGSIPVAIARLGFADPARAKSLLDDPALGDLIRTREHIEAEGLAAALSEVPDPDGALLGLVRFMESVRREPTLRAAVTTALGSPGPARQRVLAVLGSSAALGDHLCAHPEHWTAVTEATTLPVDERVRRLVTAVTTAGPVSPSDVW